MLKPLTVHAINLPKRKDRKLHITKQFTKRAEFDLKIVSPVLDTNGARSLWRTLKAIIRENIAKEFLIICEDDHEFTEYYSIDELFNFIQSAIKMKAEFLSGGVSWIETFFPVDKNMYWMDGFNGTQFIIIFKSLYSKILNSKFNNTPADILIGNLAKTKFVIFPFISVQKDFGYSDATIFNNKKGLIEKLFRDSALSFESLNKIVRHYYSKRTNVEDNNLDINKITVPTYIINLPERTDRLKHIQQQFKNKPEFEIRIVEAIKNEIPALGLWKSIRKIVQLAIKNDDDVIVICKDDHEFTKNYSKKYLFSNIIEAYQQNVNYLAGGTSAFRYAIPVSENRYWIHPCQSTQFLVIYKNFFRKILDEPYDKKVKADLKLSEMTSSKMTLFPFISLRKDFEYSNEFSRFIDSRYPKTQKRLKKIKDATLRFSKNRFSK